MSSAVAADVVIAVNPISKGEPSGNSATTTKKRP